MYKRNKGMSIIAKKPQVMQLLAVVSCFSWFAFEFLNFFVMENWYYPNNQVFSNFGNVFWFLLSYTTVLPAIIEWYMLLRTCSLFRDRYRNGPKFWGFWNFGSEWFHESMPTNPNYWKYSVPYLDKIHIFSKMPILGYFGYLFFGLNCWIIWLIAAYIFNFDADFEVKEPKSLR
ncbi:MAG: hypothetical protein K6T94_10090 [Paenibacillus sp.]|nr:hypothetical protein [Paenibacillus sp.]